LTATIGYGTNLLDTRRCLRYPSAGALITSLPQDRPMLRSLLIFLQNQKAKLIFVCFAALAMLLVAKIVIKYTGTYNSVIATTPTTKSANTLLQSVVESYNNSHSLSKFTIYEASNIDENLGSQADFAVISPGTVIPNEFEVIASLNEEKLILVSHQGNRFEYLKDIHNATINIVHVDDYDEGVLRRLFDFFETAEQQNKIAVMTLDDFLESKISPNRTVYAFFLNPFSSTASKIFKTSGQRLCDKCNVIEVDLAELAEYSHRFFSSTIKKGELRIHLLLPPEDIDTVSAFTYLVAKTSVSEEVVYRMLTLLNTSRKLIFDKAYRETLLSIEEISEYKKINFHHVYKKFLNGENEGFFQKYSDTIYISGVALSVLVSFFFSKYKKKKTKSGVSYQETLDLFEYLERNWCEDLSGEDKEQVLKLKNILCALIVNRSSKKNIAVNSLIGCIVLTNITNALRQKSRSA